MLNDNQCWDAVIERDRRQDGQFFFGVTTTGIFCRPSCPARRPLRKNVRFYPSARGAQDDGLRPCRRCHPLDTGEDQRVAQMQALCAYIRRHCDSGDPLTLEVLGRQVGMRPDRLRRLFREIVGVTPRQYVEVSRFDRLKRGLREGEPVTRAIYDAGFGSSSRVYEQASEQLGMTPSAYRDRGKGLEISFAVAKTVVGQMLVAATDRGLCSVQLGDEAEALRAQLRDEFPAAELDEKRDARQRLGPWVAALQRHLEGREPHLDLPLDIRATSFQLQVWRALRAIPYGETRTYAEVARSIGKPKAVRAVASACAANRTALAIPCHRVIRSDGGLGGYRWGVDRKEALLTTERAR